MAYSFLVWWDGSVVGRRRCLGPEYAKPGPEYAKPGPEYAKPGPEYAKPGPEYAKPRPWAPLGGSLGQSREDVGHILGSFGEPSGVKKGCGKRLRSFSTEC